MMKQYPLTVSENYQKGNSLNKYRITAMLKIIWTGDASKKSGCGRVTFMS